MVSLLPAGIIGYRYRFSAYFLGSQKVVSDFILAYSGAIGMVSRKGPLTIIGSDKKPETSAAIRSQSGKRKKHNQNEQVYVNNVHTYVLSPFRFDCGGARV